MTSNATVTHVGLNVILNWMGIGDIKIKLRFSIRKLDDRIHFHTYRLSEDEYGVYLYPGSGSPTINKDSDLFPPPYSKKHNSWK